MAEDHKPGVETRLENYARRRRSELTEPVEPSPLVRRQLLEEFRRTHSAGPTSPWRMPGWLRRLAPRLIWATPALAVLVLAVHVWRREPAPKTDTLAAASKPTVREAADGPVASSRYGLATPAPQPITPPPSAMPERLADQSRGAAATIASPVASDAQAPTSRARYGQLSDATRAGAEPPSVVPLAEAPSPAEATASPAPLPGLASSAARHIEVAIAEPAPKSTDAFVSQAATVGPVLARFRVESQGQELRVIDADGSVYRGQWLATAPSRQGTRSGAKGIGLSGAAGGRSAVQPETLRDAAAAGAPRDMAFTVQGTNRTLNQWVVFRGTSAPPQLRAASNRLFLNTLSAPRSGEAAQPVGFAPTPESLGAVRSGQAGFVAPGQTPDTSQGLLRIQGQATVAGTNAIPVTAFPLRP